MAASRAKPKAGKKVDFSSGQRLVRKLEPFPQSPWTTTERSWRAASAPLLWPEELRSSLSPPPAGRSRSDDDASEDPFTPERVELDEIKKSCRQINKFYIPISKLPPLGGQDPRHSLSKGPPSCAPGRAVPRAHLLMQRWQSVPQRRSQLPAESLHAIQAASIRDEASLVPTSRRQDHDRLTVGKSAHYAPCSNCNSARSDSDRQPRSFRQDTNTRLARAFAEMEAGSARGKKEYPHIPCACCDHKVKPWQQPKSGRSSAREDIRSKSASPMPSDRRAHD
jgi:hypothetical protein